MVGRMIRITEQAKQALRDAQAPHETYSDTILRLIQERKEGKA
jgi:predicted CopG family antitoxin